MTSPTSTAAPLTFEAFWRWLSEHRNCVVRCGVGDVMFFDHELVHWDFFDEADGRAVAQVILGKTLIAELVIERSEVLFVQAVPDHEDPQRGHWLFECIGGPREDSYPLYSFVVTHGMEQAQGHAALKH